MPAEVLKYTDHALLRMGECDVTFDDVRGVLEHGVIVEEYPDDPRGPSCLMLGSIRGRPLHVCAGVAHLPDVREIITVYEPTLDESGSPIIGREGAAHDELLAVQTRQDAAGNGNVDT